MSINHRLAVILLLSASNPLFSQSTQDTSTASQAVPNNGGITQTLTTARLPLPSTLGALPLRTSESNIAYDKAVTVTVHLKNPPAALSKATTLPLEKTFKKKVHFTSGFDAADKPVSELTFADTNEQRRREHVEDVQHIRVRDGRTTLLDSNNKPLPVPSAAGAIQPNLLGNLHSRALGSPLGSVVVKDVDHFASMRHGTVSHQDLNHATVTFTKQDRTATLTYQRQADRWALTSEATTADSAKGTITETAVFSNVKWFENSTGDQRRNATATPLAMQTAKPANTQMNFGTGAYKQALRTREQPPNTLVHGAPSRTVGASSLMAFNSGAAGSDMVFLHGILSSGSTWDRMIPWLSSDFAFSSTYAPSYGNGGKNGLVSWAQEADGDLSSHGKNYLAIGHSAGGLVGRSLAVSDPSTVRGIIAVDTPFQGAMSLKNGFDLIQQAAVYGVGIAAGEACAAFDFTDCGVLSGTLGYVAIAGVDAYVGLNYGMALDLSYKSPYTQLLSPIPVPVPHAYVATLSDSRWLEYRLGADFFSYPDDVLGGRNVVLLAEGAYDGLNTISFIWDQYAQDYYNQDDYTDGDFYEQLSYYAADGAYYMDMGDYYFNYFVTTDLASGDTDPYGSDGLVQFTSQIDPDPSAPGQIIQGGDDHVASTKSSYVRTALDNLLQLQMFTPPITTPTNCSYSAALTTGSTVPYTGGFVTLYITTQPGCPWTLTPNSPFIVSNLLPSTGIGSGYGEVFFNVNIADYPIQGSLILANQSVLLQQDAKPSNMGVGIVSVQDCTPQDNCVQTGNGDTYFSVSVGGVTTTEACTDFVVTCIGSMAYDLSNNPALPIVAIQDYIQSRLFILSTDPSFANASLDASVSNGTPALTRNIYTNPDPVIVSVSGPNLVP